VWNSKAFQIYQKSYGIIAHIDNRENFRTYPQAKSEISIEYGIAILCSCKIVERLQGLFPAKTL